MIVLDTNVLSEPLRAAPAAAVIAWMSAQTDAVVTAISVAELLSGARRLPSGARRERLIGAIERVLVGAEVLPFDDRAAREYAEMQETRRLAGRPLSVEDGMIAAIARAHAGIVATRNTAGFEGLRVDLIDPWSHTGR